MDRPDRPVRPVCSKNSFCASLEVAQLDKLCDGCVKRYVKAGSFEGYEGFSDSAILLVSGAIYFDADISNLSNRHILGRPTSFLAVPGRMLALDMTFFGRHNPRFSANVVQCLADCELALFKHNFIHDLFNSDVEFANQIAKTMVIVMQDACELAAILRAGYVYDSVYRLLCLLKTSRIYLNQQQIALVTNRDRTSVAKALHKIKTADPGLWQKYRECRA